MIRILPLLALVLALVGCETNKVMIGDPYFARVKSKANVYAHQAQSKVLKIAVMPFKASTELIGSSVSDMVVTELLRTQKYSLVERGQMSKVLSETELAMAGLSETKAVEVAKLMGAEAVVIGTVDEYAMQAKGGDTYAVVGLSIRLIDCATAKIVWSADLAKIAGDDDTPLAAHARDVVHELVAGLYQNLVGQVGDLPPPPPEGVSVGDMGLREAKVRWTKPPHDAKYRVERSKNESGPFTSVGEVSAAAGVFRDAGGLSDGETYYYRVRAVGRSGAASDPSPVVETMTAPPPDAPGGVTAAALSSRCIRVSWQAPRSEGVVSYRLERSPAGGDSWKTVAEQQSTVFVDGGKKGCDLADSSKYAYRVVAVNRVGARSEASAAAEAVTPPPPSAVRDFSAASREIRCVPLSWRASPEDDVEGYEIERADGDGAFAPLARIAKRATVRFLDGKSDPGNLPDLHAYRYRIRSFNGVGAFSKWSAAEATTKPKPSTPAGVATTRDEPGRVSISWKKNPEPDIAEYRVEVKSMGGLFWKTLATTREPRAAEGGLKPGEERSYRVMAVGPKNHESEWSAPVAGSARPLPPPPSGLSAEPCEDGYRLTFKPPRDGMSAFRVYRKKFMGTDFLAAVKECEAVVPAPMAGETMDVVVTCVDECELESEQSAKLTIGK